MHDVITKLNLFLKKGKKKVSSIKVNKKLLYYI